jgi:hypothetical protein
MAQIGSKGGKRTAEKMTPDERRARAIRAVRAREQKRIRAAAAKPGDCAHDFEVSHL